MLARRNKFVREDDYPIESPLELDMEALYPNKGKNCHYSVNEFFDKVSICDRQI